MLLLSPFLHRYRCHFTLLPASPLPACYDPSCIKTVTRMPQSLLLTANRVSLYQQCWRWENVLAVTTSKELKLYHCSAIIEALIIIALMRLPALPPQARPRGRHVCTVAAAITSKIQRCYRGCHGFRIVGAASILFPLSTFYGVSAIASPRTLPVWLLLHYSQSPLQERHSSHRHRFGTHMPLLPHRHCCQRCCLKNASCHLCQSHHFTCYHCSHGYQLLPPYLQFAKQYVATFPFSKVLPGSPLLHCYSDTNSRTSLLQTDAFVTPSTPLPLSPHQTTFTISTWLELLPLLDCYCCCRFPTVPLQECYRSYTTAVAAFSHVLIPDAPTLRCHLIDTAYAEIAVVASRLLPPAQLQHC